MQQEIESFLAAVDRISDAFGILAAACLVILIGSMAYEVVARYVFLSPTVWAFDVSTMAYGLLYISAAGVALRKKQHIMIDFLYDRMPAFWQHLSHLLIYLLLVLPAMLFMSWAGLRETWTAHVNHETTKITPLALTLWPFYLALAASIITLMLQVIAQILRHYLELLKVIYESRMLSRPVAGEQ